jgi:hypothetical protein
VVCRFRRGISGIWDLPSTLSHRVRKLFSGNSLRGLGHRFAGSPVSQSPCLPNPKVIAMSRFRISLKLCLAFLLGTVLMSGTAMAGNPFQRIADHIITSAIGNGSVGGGYSSYWRLPPPPRPHCGPIRRPVHPPVYPPIVQPIYPPVYPPPIFCPPYGHRGPGLTPHSSPWGGYRHRPRTY